ncbi:MAG: HD domain-containing protein [Patescibacteria group bacterium]|jgi:putative nucleotidyltransferase with HDIG domain
MEYKHDLVEKTKEFVKRSFQKNPHFSFNHWSVMYNHSVTVQELVMKISEEVECNKTVAAIGALLHDIGKTHHADPETLHKNHESFNLSVSQEFLNSLGLDIDELKHVRDIISYSSDSTEMKIVKDADAVALYFDKKLYMLWIEWVFKNGLTDEIQRKLGKFDLLNFDISRRLGKPKLEQMKNDWDEYQRKIKGV